MNADENDDDIDQLVADLDDMDNDFFSDKTKETDKPVSSKPLSSEPKKDGKKVTFQKALPINNNDEDWDSADDLLNSEEEKKEKSIIPKGKVPLKSTNEEKLNCSNVSSTKPDKSKFMSDLFGDSTATDPEKKSVELKSTPKTLPKKDISFDDDSDHLNMGSKNESTNHFDSLFGPKTSLLKSEKKTTKEFAIPDQYKSNSNFKSPSKSPKKEQGLSGSSNPLDDLFGENTACSRRRGPSQWENKPFEINDEDILGEIKTKGSIPSDTKNLQKDAQKTSKKDDWLFGSPKGTPLKIKEQIDQNPVLVTVEKGSGASASPKKQDWMDSLLTSKKSSPPDTLIQNGSQIKLHAEGKYSKEMEAAHSGPKVASDAVMIAFDNTPMVSSYASNFPRVLTEQQIKMQAEVSTMMAQLQAQRQEAEALMLKQFQLQMQEQQQKMAQILTLQRDLEHKNIRNCVFT